MKHNINSLIEPPTVIRQVDKFQQSLMEESMMEFGLLTPIVIANGTIVDGYRRWLVARGLGWQEIECHEVEGDPEQLRIVCQTRQSDFKRADKKILVAQYIERNPQTTAAEVACAFKWSPIEVEELCCIGYMVPAAKEAYDMGDIVLNTAWLLGRLLPGAQLELLDVDDLPSLHERAEAQLREVKHSRRSSNAKRPRVKSYNKIEKESETPVYAGEKIIIAECKTPLDGWIAALKWVIEGK